MENKANVLSAVNKLSEDYKIGMTLSDYSVDQSLEFVAVADKIDDQTIAEKFLPEIREKLLNMGGLVSLLHPVIEKASTGQDPGQKQRVFDCFINQYGSAETNPVGLRHCEEADDQFENRYYYCRSINVPKR